LPHCVGVVTDTTGEEEGTSAAYMLKRFLESLNAEIKRRKLLLSSLGVDNIDAYIRALRIIRQIKELEGKPGTEETIEKLKKKLNDKQLKALNKDLKEFPIFPTLFWWLMNLPNLSGFQVKAAIQTLLLKLLRLRVSDELWDSILFLFRRILKVQLQMISG